MWNEAEQQSCPSCMRPVTQQQSRLAAGYRWHDFCFKCCSCQKMLDSSKVVEQNGILFCQPCYQMRISAAKTGCAAIAGPEPFRFVCVNGLGTRLTPVRTELGYEVTDQIDTRDGCPRCGELVYDAEKRLAIGQKWHIDCFNCARCRVNLLQTNFEERDNDIFCRSCYLQCFGPQRVAYGIRVSRPNALSR